MTLSPIGGGCVNIDGTRERSSFPLFSSRSKLLQGHPVGGTPWMGKGSSQLEDFRNDFLFLTSISSDEGEECYFPSSPYLTIIFEHMIAAPLKGRGMSCQAARDWIESPLTVKVSISSSTLSIRQREEGLGAPGEFLTSLMRTEILGAEKVHLLNFQQEVTSILLLGNTDRLCW